MYAAVVTVLSMHPSGTAAIMAECFPLPPSRAAAAIIRWSLGTLPESQTKALVQSWSPDERNLAPGVNYAVILPGGDFVANSNSTSISQIELRRWDDLSLIRTLAAPHLEMPAFSSDGCWLAGGIGEKASLALFDPNSGQIADTAYLGGWIISGVTFSRDSHLVAVCSAGDGGGAVTVFDVGSGKLITLFEELDRSALHNHCLDADLKEATALLTFSPEGGELVVDSGSVALYDTGNGQLKWFLPRPAHSPDANSDVPPDPGVVVPTVFSDDGELVAVSDPESVRSVVVLNRKTGDVVRRHLIPSPTTAGPAIRGYRYPQRALIHTNLRQAWYSDGENLRYLELNGGNDCEK